MLTAKMFETKNNDIEAIKDIILQTIPCKRIYLFGSYAYGTPHKDSDYDFYVVVPDDGMRPSEATDEINYALYKKTGKKPVDVLVKKFSDFEGRKFRPTIEKEVFNKGVILYEV